VGYAELPTQGGGFTDYPTQAGAKFQGAGERALTAFHPYGCFNSEDGAATALDPIWEYNLMDEPFEPQHDACPPGWRRPSSESMTDEVPQSLWEDTSGALTTENNTRNNTIFGYYADGWFDRRILEDSPRNFYVHAIGTLPVPASTVNPASADMAFHGNLYFNRSTGASLFMPAAGYYNNIGYPLYLGLRGLYWTSTMNNATSNSDSGRFQYGYQLHFHHASKSNMVVTGWERNDACTVRCVVDPTVILPEFDYLVGQFRLKQQSDIDIGVMIFNDKHNFNDYNKARPYISLLPRGKNPGDPDYHKNIDGYLGYTMSNEDATYQSVPIGAWGGDPNSTSHNAEDGYWSGESFMVDVKALDAFPKNSLSRYINIYICARWYEPDFPNTNNEFRATLWLEYWQEGKMKEDLIYSNGSVKAYIYRNEGGVDVNPEKGQTPDLLELNGNSPGQPTFESWLNLGHYNEYGYAPPTRLLRVRYDREAHEAVAIWYHKVADKEREDENWPNWEEISGSGGGSPAPPMPAHATSSGRVQARR
jgi:hypothetical protein